MKTKATEEAEKTDRARASDRKRGAILGVVMIVMVLMGMIGSGLVKLGARDGIETVRHGQRTQAFWLAEAGLHESIDVLAQDDWFRDGISRGGWNTYGPFNYGAGTYECRIRRGAAGTAESNTYFVVSTGTLIGETRRVTQTAVIDPEGYDMPFYSNAITAWTVHFNNGVTVDGPVSCFETNASPRKILDDFEYRSPPVTPPPLDTSAYDALIRQAAAAGIRTNSITSLSNRTVYVQGDVTLPDLSGPGTLVASGNIETGNSAEIDPNIRLIAGNTLSFGTRTQVGTNCLLYGGTAIEFNQGGTVVHNSIMITPGSILGRQSFEMSGVMYAGTSIDIRQGATIRGAMISGGLGVLLDLVDLNNGTEIIHDPSVFPPNPPYGLGGVYVVRSQWREM